jgi:serine/threonine-protein kinase
LIDAPAPPRSQIYCPGCNEQFLQSAGDRHCPRCGVVVPTAGVTAANRPTLLWKTGPRDDHAAAHIESEEDRQMQQLVGRALDVYDCEALLGRGGMGWVFLARHRDLQRSCALKILAPRLLEHDADFLARFLNEARAAAALVHPNIVTTHAIGRHEEFHFLEMEFVPGRSLQQLIDAAPLSPVRATKVAAQIAAGLAAAHRAEILHRDLKPDNVLLTHSGIPKIGDFGLAKRIASRSEADGREELAGTPNFMAPELFAGQPASPASDVYSLGVCYFLMLTGRLPFARPRLTDLIAAVVDEPLPGVRDFRSDVSLEMAECVSLLMSRTPANRPRDGTEAAQLLEAILGQVQDVETLLREALADEPGITYQPTETGHEVHVCLPDGRRQTVFIEQSQHAALDRLLLIYSTCCPTQPEFYETALRLNATVCHGAIAVRDVWGIPYFVMVDTYPRTTVDPEEVRRSVLEIASHADAVERALTDHDRH